MLYGKTWVPCFPCSGSIGDRHDFCRHPFPVSKGNAGQKKTLEYTVGWFMVSAAAEEQHSDGMGYLHHHEELQQFFMDFMLNLLAPCALGHTSATFPWESTAKKMALILETMYD